MDEITLKLNSPITDEQWDAITDVDFEHTNEISFHTKHGKIVKFVKASAEPQWVLCSERLPESDGRYLVTTAVGFCKVTTMRTFVEEHWWQVESTQAVLDKDVLAWAELPEPC